MKTLAFLLLINIVATGVLFFATVDRGEPFVGPLSEVSMLLRWVVIAVVVAFLEVLALMGWKRGERD